MQQTNFSAKFAAGNLETPDKNQKITK